MIYGIWDVSLVDDNRGHWISQYGKVIISADPDKLEFIACCRPTWRVREFKGTIDVSEILSALNSRNNNVHSVDSDPE